MLSEIFFKKDAETVAKELIGKVITYNGKAAMITETEAYGTTDPFCYGFAILFANSRILRLLVLITSFEIKFVKGILCKKTN